MTESKLTISWEKEGHIFCDFWFSSSFQKIDMILLTRPEGGLIGLIILISQERTVLAGTVAGSTDHGTDFSWRGRFLWHTGTAKENL